MGRTLPWANTANTTSSKRERPTQIKPTPEPKVKDETADESDSFLLNTPDKRQPDLKRKRNVRASSTSPPAIPPSVNFMREGIHGDDIYMLVEDEFQTMAQSFTAHLHMAEYQRLKSQARERQTNETGVVVAGGSSIDVTHKHGRTNLVGRQKNVLDEVTDQREEEEQPVVEPWAGTTLAGLMRWDGSQKTSLKGLDGLNSASRAAMGHRPNSEKVTQSQGAARTTIEDGGKAVAREENVRPDKFKLGERHEKKKPELEVVSQSSSRTEEKAEPTKRERPRSGKAHRELDTQPTHDISAVKLQVRPDEKARSFLDDLDDFDEAGFASTSQAEEQHQPGVESVLAKRSRSKPPTTALTKREEKSQDVKKKDRSSRYDEIPVFLF